MEGATKYVLPLISRYINALHFKVGLLHWVFNSQHLAYQTCLDFIWKKYGLELVGLFLHDVNIRRKV